MAKKTFVIIDGNAIVHRAFHALPPLLNKEGKLVNAAYGFTTIFLKTLKDLKPEYIAVTFDVAGPTFRHKEFTAYKAQREKKPQDLYDQFPIIKNILGAFGVAVFEKQGFEADDLIGTLSEKALQQSDDVDVVVVTGDMDTLQLISDRIKVATLKTGISETVLYTEDAVKKRYGLSAGQMIDFKALRGDPSDNIPGVKGIGEKTATELLKTFGTVEALYEAVDQMKKEGEVKGMTKRVFTLLSDSKKDAMLSKRLVTIVRNAPITLDLEKVKLGTIDRAKAVELFQAQGFKSLLSRLKELNGQASGSKTKEGLEPTSAQESFFLPSGAPKSSKDQAYVLVDTDKAFADFLRKLSEETFFVFDTETTSLDPLDAKLLGISFSWKKGEAFFVSTVRLPKSLALLKPLLENEKIQKGGHNMKYDIRVLLTSGVHVRGANFDTMVASYILNPGMRQHNLDRIVFEEFGYEMMPIEALIGIKKKDQIPMEDVSTDRLSWYSCEDADFTHRLYEKFSKDLKAKKLEKLFFDIDMPMVPLLSEMEQWGIKVDLSYLEKMSKEIHTQLNTLHAKIIKLAGTDFNVSSTQQLKEILFEKLKISTVGIARGKTGLSTAASELEKLQNAHPIIPLILEHRELSKIASTYVDTFPALIHPKTGRIHSSFNQTVTATGRLSSSDPNLQNIPIRTDFGKRVRQAFIAEKGNVLVSADYSQIELRIVAALSKDPKMTDAFVKGEDIHRRTAAEIWEVLPEKVTPDMRRNAKAINFGIIYGMGPAGLSAGAGIPYQEAQAFIDKYFLVHKGIRAYLDKTKKMADEKGYVETLFGRRRYFPEMQTQHQGLRAAAEREAVNHPIQGTASDIMKIAMRRLSSAPQVLAHQWKMILQVHDELVFEVPEKDVAQSAKIIQDMMEKACDLGIPVVVDVKAGKNWGEMDKVTT